MAKQMIAAALGLIFMFHLISTGLGAFTCDPKLDCNTSMVGDFVPDPHDCEQYYVCVDAGGSTVPSLIPIHCGYGYYFDHGNRTCLPEETPDECINYCQNLCPNGCQGNTDGSFASFRGDCSMYYVCLLNPILASCGVTTPYFNGTFCVTDSTQCCDFCEPFCERVGQQIQDPCDCTSYYVCTGEGEPSVDNKGTCEAGFYYDEATAKCVSGVCFNFCSTEQCAVRRLKV